MIVFTDGWCIETTHQSARTGTHGREVVTLCCAHSEGHDGTGVASRDGTYCEFVVGSAVASEPMPRYALIAALKKQPAWKAWEKKRLAGER